MLAAGASRRLGQPKALVTVDDGRTILEVLLDALRVGLPGVAPVVVAGAHAAELLPEATRLGAHAVEHTGWESGRVGSLRAGLEALPSGAPEEGVLVWPVDRPGCTGLEVANLVAAWSEAGAPPGGWLSPRGPGGRHGHPLLLGRDLAAAIRGLDPGADLRALRRAADPLWALPVSHAGTELNLDRPEDLAAVRAWVRKHAAR
ncbi:MAG: NTP transferase domain-containing protein [Planctomycetes bacterium]|nr:NTP transferase domain-containing protein [Planctomycetota bacterium]